MARDSRDLGLVPGAFVRHPGEPGWGVGQVQSVIGGRATVNFQNRGKVVIVTSLVALEIIDPSAENQQ